MRWGLISQILPLHGYSVTLLRPSFRHPGMAQSGFDEGNWWCSHFSSVKLEDLVDSQEMDVFWRKESPGYLQVHDQIVSSGAVQRVAGSQLSKVNMGIFGDWLMSENVVADCARVDTILCRHPREFCTIPVVPPRAEIPAGAFEVCDSLGPLATERSWDARRLWLNVVALMPCCVNEGNVEEEPREKVTAKQQQKREMVEAGKQYRHHNAVVSPQELSQERHRVSQKAYVGECSLEVLRFEQLVSQLALQDFVFELKRRDMAVVNAFSLLTVIVRKGEEVRKKLRHKAEKRGIAEGEQQPAICVALDQSKCNSETSTLMPLVVLEAEVRTCPIGSGGGDRQRVEVDVLTASKMAWQDKCHRTLAPKAHMGQREGAGAPRDEHSSRVQTVAAEFLGLIVVIQFDNHLFGSVLLMEEEPDLDLLGKQSCLMAGGRCWCPMCWKAGGVAKGFLDADEVCRTVTVRADRELAAAAVHSVPVANMEEDLSTVERLVEEDPWLPVVGACVHFGNREQRLASPGSFFNRWWLLTSTRSETPT